MKSPQTSEHYGATVKKVEIGRTVDMRRAEASKEIADLLRQLSWGQVPAIVINAEAAKEHAGDEDIFDVLQRDTGLLVIGQDKKLPTPSLTEDPLHTDRPIHVPKGSQFRLHEITSPHTSVVRIGQVIGRLKETGVLFQETDGAKLRIPEMHTTIAGQGDVTMFRLSPNVAHQYSSPAEGVREYRIRNLGYN